MSSNGQAVAIVLVGDELLDGRVQDSNGTWLVDQLRALGHRVASIQIVPDEIERIVTSMEDASKNAALLLVSGGLGPTVDDLTRDALAQFVGEELIEDAEALAAIRERFAHRSKPIPAGNERQALRTATAELLRNPIGTAPGLWQEHDSLCIALLPGVPVELRKMFAEQVSPRMANLHLEASLPSVRLRTLGEGESAIAERVHAVLRGSSEIRSSFCVHAGGVDVLLESEQRGVLADAADAVERELAPEFFARGIIEFEELLLETLRDRRETLAVAESCTGGLLAARLSAVPGCSDVFHGGVVAYANSVKHELLGVSDSLLASEGAVSEATALAMARGVRERLAATWSLSITGIAGPDGGSPEKPVGTTWLGCVGPHTEATQLLRLPGNREQNRVWAAARALHQLAVTMGGQRSDH